MTLRSFALPMTFCVVWCAGDYTHTTSLESRLVVDGRSYVVQRQIANETIMNTDADPQYWAVVGPARYNCNSTRASGCAGVIRQVEAQARAAAAN